jgi:quercetin dioxygenase-like cupin family protein
MYLPPGYRCSQHYHAKKDETFYVLIGEVLLHVNGVVHLLKQGDFYRIKPFDVHYFESPVPEGAIFLEASTYHDDKDVVRMTDSCKIT